MIKPIHACINAKIARIYVGALELDSYTDKVRSVLPEPLSEHVRVGSLVDGQLTLCTSSEWSTELYYEKQTLLNALRSNYQLFNIRGIKISTQDTTIDVQGKTSISSKIQPNADGHTKAIINSIQTKTLKQALKRLFRL